MFFDFLHCDLCPYWDDESKCPLVTGGILSDCNIFVSALDDMEVTEE